MTERSWGNPTEDKKRENQTWWSGHIQWDPMHASVSKGNRTIVDRVKLGLAIGLKRYEKKGNHTRHSNGYF